MPVSAVPIEPSSRRHGNTLNVLDFSVAAQEPEHGQVHFCIRSCARGRAAEPPKVWRARYVTRHGGDCMKQYSWTLMRPGAIPNIGVGTLDEVAGAVHRCQLPGIPSAAWLMDEMKARQDLTGTARYNYALGHPDEWRFAWIAK
jgi:hypothetical protein